MIGVRRGEARAEPEQSRIALNHTAALITLSQQIPGAPRTPAPFPWVLTHNHALSRTPTPRHDVPRLRRLCQIKRGRVDMQPVQARLVL